MNQFFRAVKTLSHFQMRFSANVGSKSRGTLRNARYERVENRVCNEFFVSGPLLLRELIHRLI